MSTLAKPPRPLEGPNPEKDKIKFYNYEDELPNELQFPLAPQAFGIGEDGAIPQNIKRGGEMMALKMLNKRLVLEKSAFEQGEG